MLENNLQFPALVSRLDTKVLANVTAELIWVEVFVRRHGISLPKRLFLWCDNLGATYLSGNHIFHAQTRHIEIDYHFIPEQVANKFLEVKFIYNKNQVADGFSKVLPIKLLIEFKCNINFFLG
jgi:hypothetical protein